MRFGKPVDMQDGGSGRRFNPFNDFVGGYAFTGNRARDVRVLWLQ